MATTFREVCWAVANAGETARRVAAVIGGTLSPVSEHPDPHIAIRYASIQLGDAKIGFLEPLTPESAVGRFLGQRGPGLFSMVLVVDDLEHALKGFEAQGAERLLKTSHEFRRDGEPGVLVRVNWIRPRTLEGVLLELQDVRPA
jgi:methylmalonyl-CoA/ethylmalonyl-CoA epimerase